MATPVVFSWSTGKDSAFGLWTLLRNPAYEVRSLITTITEDDFANVGYNLIPHWKLHLIARFKGDAVKLEWGRQAEPGPSTRGETATLLRRHLSWVQHRNG